MKKFLTSNKCVIIFLIALYGVLTFCHFQTFLSNDDLAYAFYLRSDERVLTLGQVLYNQISDYFHISPRIFIHTLLQTFLIFDKNLWSFINPLFIIAGILLMSYIAKIIIKKEVSNFTVVLWSTITYLLLFDFKSIIYWVAGSVNYVFVFILIGLFTIYYLNFSLTKKTIISAILCLLLSMIHESLAVFVLILIIGDLILNFFQKNITKKLSFKYVLFILMSIIGMSFLLMAPANNLRVSMNPEFYELSILEKVFAAIPIVSENLYGDFSIYKLIPIFFIISGIIFIYKNNKKLSLYHFITTLILLALYIMTDNAWVCFIYSVLLFFVQSYIFFKNKDYKLMCVLLALYAISYSLIITPQYIDGRPNMFVFLFMGIFTIYNLFKVFNENKILKFILLSISFALLIIEIIIYNYIGSIKQERIKSINDYNIGKENVLELKKIQKPYSYFHMDPNEPGTKDHWTYRYFKNYHKIKDDPKIKWID